MNVYLMIMRKKTSILADANETTKVLELKKIVQGYSKIVDYWMLM